MLEIRLFGLPEIRQDGVVVDPDTRKALAVTALVTLSAGTTSRDTLAAMLWPESSEARAKAALRRTLSSLRSVVGDALEADRHGVRLNPTKVSVDAVQMESELDQTRQHGHPVAEVCDRCLAHLETAADLYRADLLAGFHVRGAPEFEAWVTTSTSHFRGLVTGALERLASGRAARGDHAGAIAAVRRWLELEPIHEPAHRHLMLLHAWAGDRAGATEAYRDCVRLLDSELGVAPLEETTELYDAILEEDLPPPPRVPPRAQPPSPRRMTPTTPLVGRETELHELSASLEQARHGGRIVAVSGEQGVGKTRLLEEFAARSGAPLVGLARAYRGEQSIPYGAVAQLVEAAVSSPAARLSELPDWVLAATARLVPDVADGRPGLAPITGEGDQTAERRFIAALELLLANCGREGDSCVMAVDDAQWLDPSSVAFLSYFMRRLGRHHLLLVLSFRGEASPADQALAPALGAAERAGLLTQVRLGPLALEDVVDLIEQSGATGLLAEEVWRRSGGLPLFVVEHIELGSPPLEVPDRLRRAVFARLEDLSDLARQILAAAAVMDGMIDPTVLQKVAGRSDEEAVEGLEELISRRLLREVPPANEVEFVYPLLRESVYDGTSLVRRRLLHRRAAESLRSVSPADPRTAAVVAHHLQSAGDDEAAAAATVHAANRAREVFAHAVAGELYRTALALGHADPATIHLALGDVALATGAYSEALAGYEAAAAHARGGDVALADHRLGEVHRRLGRFDVAEGFFRRAEPEHPNRTDLYADWSMLERRRGMTEEARRLAELAKTEAERVDDRPGLARAMNILGLLSDDPGESSARLRRSLDLAGADVPLRTAALNNLGVVAERSGDIEKALDLTQEALELARQSGDRHRQAALHNRLADLHHAQGDHEASRGSLTEAVRLFAEVDSEPGTWEPEIWLLTQW